jgi:mono/diheme cytochrome c family protein
MILRFSARFAAVALGAVLVGAGVSAAPASAAAAPPKGADTPPTDSAHAHWSLIDRYCVECHNVTDWAGGVAFDSMSPNEIPADAKEWEAAIRKLRGGFMPPPNAKHHPDSQTVNGLISWLENTLDAAETQVDPGRIPLGRLNRREYRNAVRDLLDLDVNVAALLPADNRPKNGFDNTAVNLQVSPSFLDQYLNAARQVATQAVGNPKAPGVTVTYGPVADMVISLPPRGTPGEGTQQVYEEGMPFGTRGGISFEHIFPADGDYQLTIGDMALGRDVPRMEFKNTVIALLDGKEFYRTDIGGDADQKAIDQQQDPAVAAINARLRNIPFHATAGEHRIAVTFLHRSFAESDERFRDTALQGGQPRVQAVHALQIKGPLKVTGVSESRSRARIFTCYPSSPAEEEPCARRIIGTLAKRAFRRPVTDEDLRPLLAFYERGHANGGFDAGIRHALTAILASPYFLYRVEAGNQGNGPRTLSDLELASRMSFFIWSSIPDDELLDLASRSELSKPDVLAHQVSRMLADPKAKSLVNGFAFQWLNVSRLDEIVPDRALFPQASGVLDPRPMFREELALFLDSVLRSDQPVTNLLTANYTFLNEPLAALYGIDSVKGGQFRRVDLVDHPERDGLLGKGAILMLTANPDRNSPVLRGAWILERVLGTPPDTPPPNVAALPETGRGKRALTMRERMAQHSVNPSCHACHGVMDPLGFTLENFDTVGQYRVRDPNSHNVIDTSGAMPDGQHLSGPADLRRALAARGEDFVETLTEKLLGYALGRNIEFYDMPTVRRIVRQAGADHNTFSSIVLQIVQSDEFRKRDAPVPQAAPPVKTASLEKTSQSTGGQ